jgi:hypothetical protein
MKRFFRISLILLFFTISSSIFLMIPQKATTDENLPWGVLDQEWYEGDEQDLGNAYIIQIDTMSNLVYNWYTGIVTKTGYPNELFLEGPKGPTHLVPKNWYVYNHDLKYKEIVAYVPMIMLESDIWYNHTFELTTSTTTQSTFSVSCELGIKNGIDQISVAYGESETTIIAQASGWTESTGEGKTKIIYVRQEFLHLYGSVTYFTGINYITYDYDVLALQYIEWDNIYPITYDAGETPDEMPKFDEVSYNPDEYYYLPSELWYNWENTKIYETSWGIDLGVISGKKGWAGIYMTASMNWVSTSGTTETYKHTFKKLAENTNNQFFDQFFFKFSNAYSMNIHPNFNPIINIATPTNGQKVKGNIFIQAIAHDDLEITAVKLYVNGNFKCNLAYVPDYYYTYLNTKDYPDKAWMTILCRAYDSFGIFADHQISVYVKQYTDGGGGDGCPILFTFNGNGYLQEELLDIHDSREEDIIVWSFLSNTLENVNNRFLLRLVEYPSTISHIDQVKLLGILPNGRLVPLPLISAIHSRMGYVSHLLWFSDDNKVDIHGAEHTNYGSEFIDLKFLAINRFEFIRYVFLIEGINYLVK